MAPASAVDVYDLRSDAQFMSLNSGLATAAADDSWYDSMLQDLEWIMFDVTDIAADVDTIRSLLGFPVHITLYDCLASLVTTSSDSLTYVGDIACWLGADSWDSNLYTLGEWLGMDSASSTSASLYDLIYSQASLTSSFKSSFEDFFSVWSSDHFLLADLRNLFSVPAGSDVVGYDGLLRRVDSAFSFPYFFNNAFRGLWTLLRSSSGASFLSTSGSSSVSSSQLSIADTIRYGFLGLSSNLKDISTGSYTVPLFMSDTGEDLFESVSTMGDMLDLYLMRLQRDIGQMAFIYADEETIQAKKDAASNESAVTDGFLSPGSVGSLSVSDIGDAAEAVSGTKDLFDTGVSVGQAFKQLQGSGPLEFFTSATAANLNTVPAMAAEDDDDFVHFYDSTNSEFFELIGKGGG